MHIYGPAMFLLDYKDDRAALVNKTHYWQVEANGAKWLPIRL